MKSSMKQASHRGMIVNQARSLPTAIGMTYKKQL